MANAQDREVARIRALDAEAGVVQAGLTSSPHPWRIQHVGWSRSIYDADGAFVANLGSVVRDYDDRPSTYPVEANARLIVKSPELAGLLRRLVDEGEGWLLVEQARALLATIDGAAPAERGQ